MDEPNCPAYCVFHDDVQKCVDKDTVTSCEEYNSEEECPTDR